MFVALSYAKLNAVRKEKYLAAKALGYRLASYVSPRATVLNDGRIGDNCFILEDNTIQPFVTIGNNVTLWSGNHIGHHSTIRDHCFIASHVVVSGGVEIGESVLHRRQRHPARPYQGRRPLRDRRRGAAVERRRGRRRLYRRSDRALKDPEQQAARGI